MPLTRKNAAAFALIAWSAAAFAPGAAAADFNVAAGYLSTNVRTLATEYGWALVWEAGEDRAIEHPFVIANDSLQGALEDLLGAYRGQFVADLYRSNKVVVVRAPPPQLEVVLPGEAGRDEGNASRMPAGDVGAVASATVPPLASEPGPTLPAEGEADAPTYEVAASAQALPVESAVAQ